MPEVEIMDVFSLQNAIQALRSVTFILQNHVLKNEIKVSMDGKGAWRDNVFVERLWRTIKYEEVYLRAYASVPEARASIGRYIDGFYNARRPHSSLDRRTPDAYFTALQPIAVAA
jgi:putative transposase